MPARARSAIALICLSAACSSAADATDGATRAHGAETRPVATIDSILPPDEAMRRFRSGAGPRRTALSGGAASAESLARVFLRALQNRDTAAIRSLVLDHVEFADLYYPASPYSRPPYQSPIGLLWTQIQLNSEKGIGRALDRIGGQPLRFVSLECPTPPEPLGDSRLHSRCVLRYATPDGVAARRLFGAIVETGGRFKFVSYANAM